MNTLLKNISLGLSVAFCTLSYGMMDTFITTCKDKSLSKYNEKNFASYAKGVEIIDTIAQEEMAKALSTIKTQPITPAENQDHTDKYGPYFFQIDKRLEQIGQNIRQEEDDAVALIANKLTPQQFHILSLVTNAYKNYANEYMSQPRKEATHNPHFPDAIIKPILTQNNINPYSVTLECSPSDTDDETLACASSPGADILFENGSWGIDEIVYPPMITLYPALAQRSAICQAANLIHEAEHIKEHHQIKKNVLKFVTSVYTQTEEKDIVNHENYKNLCTIHERQAEILPSLRNADWAQIIKSSRAGEYYPDHLFLEHYAQLAEINALHELKSKISAS